MPSQVLQDARQEAIKAMAALLQATSGNPEKWPLDLHANVQHQLKRVEVYTILDSRNSTNEDTLVLSAGNTSIGVPTDKIFPIKGSHQNCLVHSSPSSPTPRTLYTRLETEEAIKESKEILQAHLGLSKQLYRLHTDRVSHLEKCLALGTYADAGEED